MSENKKIELDFYQLMVPVVNMILWEYGLNLVGDADDCQLNCYDYELFRKKLMKELNYSLEKW